MSLLSIVNNFCTHFLWMLTNRSHNLSELLILTVVLYTGLLFVFASFAVSLFRKNDEFHFGNMRKSMLTLFRCSTLEDWSDVMYTQIYGCTAYPPHPQGYTCTASEKKPVTGRVRLS